MEDIVITQLDNMKKWQHRLLLDNWNISLYENLAPEQMKLESVAGVCSYTASTRCADIQLLDEIYLRNYPEAQDVEKTLVHELLHVKFAILFDNLDGVAELLLHQTIDDLSKSLIAAERAGNEPKIVE